MEEHDHKGDYFITLQEVCRRTGLSKNVIYEYIRKYNFPRPVKMPGGRASRWWSNEVNAWMAALPRAVGDLGRWASTAD